MWLPEPEAVAGGRSIRTKYIVRSDGVSKKNVVFFKGTTVLICFVLFCLKARLVFINNAW